MRFFGFQPRGTGRITPEFIAPPREPAGLEVELRARIERARARLNEFLEAQELLYLGDQNDEAVNLSFELLALLAGGSTEPPVVPGRPS